MRHIGACDWEIAAHWSSLYFENGNEGYSVNVLTGHSKSIKDIHFMYSKKPKVIMLPLLSVKV